MKKTALGIVVFLWVCIGVFAITYEDVVGSETPTATQASNIRTLVARVNQLLSAAGLSTNRIVTGGFESSGHTPGLHDQGRAVDLRGDKAAYDKIAACIAGSGLRLEDWDSAGRNHIHLDIGRENYPNDLGPNNGRIFKR
jgi:hypothetical protein